jgi:hypothetical protein
LTFESERIIPNQEVEICNISQPQSYIPHKSIELKAELPAPYIITNTVEATLKLLKFCYMLVQNFHSFAFSKRLHGGLRPKMKRIKCWTVWLSPLLK